MQKPDEQLCRPQRPPPQLVGVEGADSASDRLPIEHDLGRDLRRPERRRELQSRLVPHFSPHGLRKRRGSLLSKQGYSLAEIAERLGDTKVVTAEHYLFALGDYAEVDHQAALARLAA